MIKRFIVLGMLLLAVGLQAYPLYFAKRVKNPNRFLRVSISPLLGFYNINTRHATKPTQRMSGVISVRQELKLDRSNKVFFLYGVDYLLHGLNFKSYYFKPDSIQLYTKKLDYNYGLYIQEVNVPLQFRLSFKNERNAVVSPYLLAGYHLRFITTANLQVTQNGNTVVKENVTVQFRNSTLVPQLSSGACVAFGVQKNPINAGVNGFVELTYRYGFSQYYFQKAYSANALFIGSGFLGLNLGLRF